MKTTSILIFATAAAADYGYGAPSTSSKLGYTTVYPGYGKAPVTVTAQYQPVPTYVDGKWSEYEAISTVIDAYGKKITVTATSQDVTVYSTKKTITHTFTKGLGYAKPTGKGYNETWYELDEEIHNVPYKHLGPHAIPGYPGNPKYTENKDEQGVTVKKYTGGKWTTYVYTYTYSAPKPSVTTYSAPGVYTVPAKDITVAYPTSVAVEKSYYAEANKPVTYGGQVTTVTKKATITAVYAACETTGGVTKTVISSKVVTCPSAGQYTIVKPTTTIYATATTITYPSITGYPAGVYHHSAETITITKSNQPYTCSFEQTSTYSVPSYPSSTPSAPGYPVYPVYPGAVSSSSAPSYPSPTPSAPVYPGASSSFSAPSYPSASASSTKPYGPDPSSDYDEPADSYGHASAGYVKRGGVLQRRKAESGPAKQAAKFAILV